MKRLVVIVGPTAVGKSQVAVELAKSFEAEIISGDSMSVYRFLDIGTAKPSPEDLAQIPHHLINVRNPEEPFSVADFQKLADEAVETIHAKGKIPILVGGTGLYIQAFLERYELSPTSHTPVRPELAHANTTDLYERLRVLDPQSAERIHANDKRRIIRALEVVMSENRPLSRQKNSPLPQDFYDCLVFGLTLPRELLYQRINFRVDLMMQNGLLEEVKSLLQRGVPSDATALQAIGYKELIDVLNNQGSLAEAIEKIKQSSRRFAKRQLTWFRRMPYIQWIQLDESLTATQAANCIAAKVAQKYSIK